MTRNPEIRFAKSIVDYIFRWLATKFLSPEAQFHAGVNGREENVEKVEQLTLTPPGEAPAAGAAVSPRPAASSTIPGSPFSTIQNQEDAPPCSTCGAIMIRSGACYKCVNCGNTSGCA
jgi:ribonucleoside-diphosphate reductase alpha chain